jgi:hypothetical protein
MLLMSVKKVFEMNLRHSSASESSDKLEIGRIRTVPSCVRIIKESVWRERETGLISFILNQGKSLWVREW